MTTKFPCLLPVKRKFKKYICNSLSQSKKDLELTIWQPFGENLFFRGGPPHPHPLKKDAWNKQWFNDIDSWMLL